uniref:Uncharacterized protein n=1 Tax=Anopheles culicifacies TaxID=139723 RepID=A0A182M1S9_9DIPT
MANPCITVYQYTSFDRLPHVYQLMIIIAIAEGILTDNPHLVLLFYLAQLFLRELIKSHRLVQVIPMDMSGYYENRAGPSNLGNVISQILLCKQITPDFNQEELCSITKDSQEIARILQELQEFMPQQESYLGRYRYQPTRVPMTTNNRPHDRNQRTLASETSARIIIQKHGPPVLRVTAQLPMNADITAAERAIRWIMQPHAVPSGVHLCLQATTTSHPAFGRCTITTKNGRFPFENPPTYSKTGNGHISSTMHHPVLVESSVQTHCSVTSSTGSGNEASFDVAESKRPAETGTIHHRHASGFPFRLTKAAATR